MIDWPAFLLGIEVAVGGLLSGVIYALVALGLVLIYKTSGVLNFTQGAMMLSAALTFVSMVMRGVPFGIAIAATLIVMAALGLTIEGTLLRPLSNRSPMVLFVANPGLSYVIEAAAQLIWRSQGQRLDLGISNAPFDIADI